jgi:hypothetical protein
MSYVVPSVPAGCEVVGRLYDMEDVEYLTGDMLEVYCPASGVLIRTGWYPEEDPQGQYVVTAYRDCRRMADSYKTKQIGEARSLVERLAVKHQIVASNAHTSSYRTVDCGDQGGIRLLTGAPLDSPGIPSRMAVYA